jgi:hypothetical protein
MPTEQLVNRYGAVVSSVPVTSLIPSVTLAAPYVAGSGSIVVSATTDPVTGAVAPTTGVFCLTIFNPQTGAVYLIFRVTSVAGTTFSGAAEGPDANAPSGAAVAGTMLTTDAIDQIKLDALTPTGVTAGSYTSTNLTVGADGRITAAANGGGGGSGFIQTLTPPVAGNFSPINFNAGGTTTTQVDNSSPVVSISLIQQDPGASLNIAGITKAPINALFTITIGFTTTAMAPNGIIGIWLTDGSAVNILFGYNPSNGWVCTVFNNFSGSFNSNIGAAITYPMPLGPIVWLRVQETSTHRIFSMSADGINFFQCAPLVANNAFFTTTQYGFAVESRNLTAGIVQGVLYSFVETTP